MCVCWCGQERKAIAKVLPKQIPKDMWMPISVPAIVLFWVSSSLPYFIPTVIRYPQVAANRPSIPIIHHWLPKKVLDVISKVSKYKAVKKAPLTRQTHKQAGLAIKSFRLARDLPKVSAKDAYVTTKMQNQLKFGVNVN